MMPSSRCIRYYCRHVWSSNIGMPTLYCQFALQTTIDVSNLPPAKLLMSDLSKSYRLGSQQRLFQVPAQLLRLPHL